MKKQEPKREDNWGRGIWYGVNAVVGLTVWFWMEFLIKKLTNIDSSYNFILSLVGTLIVMYPLNVVLGKALDKKFPNWKNKN